MCGQYTYLFSVPCIIGYAIGFAVIKYQEGYVDLSGYGSTLCSVFLHPRAECTIYVPLPVIARPWQLWTQTHKSFILPLYLLFTVAWSLEM